MKQNISFDALHEADSLTLTKIDDHLDGSIPLRIAETDEHPMYKILTLGNYVSTVDGISDLYLRNMESVSREQLERGDPDDLPDDISELMDAARISIHRAIDPSDGSKALEVPQSNILDKSPLHSLYAWFRMNYGKDFYNHINGIAYEGGIDAEKTQQDVDNARLRVSYVTGQLILPVLHTASDLFKQAVSESSPFKAEFDDPALRYLMGNLRSSVPITDQWPIDNQEAEPTVAIW